MLNIYITNLGKYNEGILVGEWAELPVSDEEFENIFKRIGINEQYEEIFITDYETDIEGLEIGEYDCIAELNELAETLENFNQDELNAFQAMLLDGYKIDEAVKKVENSDYCIYYDCDNMTDVAHFIVEENGYLENVNETVSRYFDYEAFGRDLDLEGKFYHISNNYVEIID